MNCLTKQIYFKVCNISVTDILSQNYKAVSFCAVLNALLKYHHTS